MRTCRRRWRLAVLGGMLGVLAACSGGDPAPAAPTPPSPPPPPPALPAGIRGVSVAPRDVTVMDGASELFIGWTFDRPADAPRPSVAVRVSDSTVASAAIDSDGIVVRPLRAGRAVVRVSASVSANASYSAATREDSLVVSVVRASVARVDLTLFGALARVGDNVTVAIALRDSVGNELSGRSVQVVSSDTAVLRVTPSGSFWTVQARAVGTASIVAQSEGRSVSEAFTIGSTAAPPPALPSAINVGILASSLLAGTTTVAPVSFPGVAATTRVVVSGVSSSSPEVATATFDSVRGLVLRAASAGRTVLRLAVTGDGPGVSSTSRTYDVATVVYA
ncbi:MAG: hypothetical protein MUF00_20525, partial [Gemmatimonadaceae bacterium]|nr:hypothetical protein [Gemmatimonadaceae bacterium]